MITNWTSDNKQFSLVLEENPLADFVELPDDGRAQDELWFSNILCGVLRGALEMVCVSCPALLLPYPYRVFWTSRSHPSGTRCMLYADNQQVQMQVDAHFVSDILKGNDTTEIRVTLIRHIEDEMPPDDE